MRVVRPLWVGYPRVSALGRRKADAEDFHSVRDQEREMRRKATELGVDLHIVDPDLNAKGKDPERAALLAIMRDVEQGRYEGVLVAYLSRLSRRTSLTLELWDRVRAAGARLIAVREGLDSAHMTPENWFLLRMLAAKDELEVDIATARFDEQREGAVAAGVWAFRQTPLGYSKGDDRRLVPDDRADDVRWAFRSAPHTPRGAIAERLGMTYAGVTQLLRNRVYLGELHVGGLPQKDGTTSPKYENLQAHPPLVTQEEWLAAQIVRPARRPRSRASHPTLLAGLVTCAGCGHVMSRANTKALVYTCHRTFSGGRCPEPASIMMRILDEHVEAIVVAHLAELRASARRHDRGLDEARVALASAKEQLSTYLEMVDAAGIGIESAAAGARQRQDRVREAERALAAALDQQPLAVDGDPVRAWEVATTTQRNRLSRGLVEAVVVRRAGGPGPRVPVGDRVRVIAHGAGIVPRYTGGGRPFGVRPVAFPDLDSPVVLRG